MIFFHCQSTGVVLYCAPVLSQSRTPTTSSDLKGLGFPWWVSKIRTYSPLNFSSSFPFLKLMPLFCPLLWTSCYFSVWKVVYHSPGSPLKVLRLCFGKLWLDFLSIFSFTCSLFFYFSRFLMYTKGT